MNCIKHTYCPPKQGHSNCKKWYAAKKRAATSGQGGQPVVVLAKTIYTSPCTSFLQMVFGPSPVGPGFDPRLGQLWFWQQLAESSSSPFCVFSRAGEVHLKTFRLWTQLGYNISKVKGSKSALFLYSRCTPSVYYAYEHIYTEFNTKNY